MRSFLIAISLMTIIACSKLKPTAPPTPIVCSDSILAILGQKDTITSGTFMGLTIGSAAGVIYKAIQEGKTNIAYLQVSRQPFSDIRLVAHSLALYTGLVLWQKTNPSAQVQFSFQENKVNAIYDGNGKKLSEWPLKITGAVKTGDGIQTAYTKLTRLQNSSNYKNYFTAIQVGSKIVKTDFDPAMEISPKWQAGTGLCDNTIKLFEFDFQDGKLYRITTLINRSFID